MTAIKNVSPIIFAIVTALTVVIVGNQLPSDLVASWGIAIDRRLIHFVIVLAISLAICWLIGSIQIYVLPFISTRVFHKKSTE